MSHFEQKKAHSLIDTGKSIHAPRKPASPRPPGGAPSGLNSLQSTLRKLRGDEERHQQLMDDMARRLRMPSRMQEHFSKSFVESGLVFMKTLGEGHFGMVKMAKRKQEQAVEDTRNNMGFPQTPKKAREASGRYLAVRIIPRIRARNQSLQSKELFTKMESYEVLRRQVDGLRSLDHPNVVRVHDTFEDFQNIYIVMQLCTGGSLLVAREMGEGKTTSEHRTVEILEQILAAMAYVHEKGMVHQDLRLENIHYECEDPDSRVVITDWGALEYISTPRDHSRKFLPSTDFSAPELVPQWRTDRSDVWSIGIIMHCLLTQAFPTWTQWPPTESFSWSQDPDGYETSFSPACRQFLESLLRLDYSQRPSAREALSDPWILGSRMFAPDDNKVLPTFIGSSIMKYRRASRMQKATAWFAATHLSAAQLHELTEIFNAVDKDRSGTISRDEMEQALRGCFTQARRELNFKHDDETDNLVEELDEVLKNENMLHGMMAAMDAEGNGVISYSEFLAATLDTFLQDSVQMLWGAFQRFDHSGTGRISEMDLSTVLKSAEVDEVLQRMQGSGAASSSPDRSTRRTARTRTVQDIEAIFSAMGGSPEKPADIIRQADEDGSGSLNFDEFVAVITEKKIKANTADADDELGI